ncbi:hypothetical protein [Parachryseolinea silvisoli]|uniref:hypothetical protein n=1 Tax=Parachryseolinea silvisoli TaxID=2873601 RepID=UPI002265C729|nr:hypothetical protein [Parachryseolinea silvisoli]MCD9018410.1 hypothetical protein [Parachryseolinea silvisoli]
MSKIISILFFLFAVVSLHAQDSLRQASPGVAGKARALLQRSKTKADSATHPRLDSLKPGVALRDSLPTEPDTLRSIQQKVGVASDRVAHAGDTITQKISSVTNKPAEVQQTVQHKADSLQQRLTQPVTSLQQKAEEKIQKVVGKDVGLPGDHTLGVPNDVSIPGVENPGIPEVEMPNVVPEIGKDLSPDVAGPGVELPGVEAPNVEVPGLDKVKGEVTDAVPEMPSEVKEVQQLTEKTKELDNTLGEAGKYQKDIEAVKAGDTESLSKQAEQHAQAIKPVGAAGKELTKATAEQAKYQSLIQRYRDEKLIQEEIKRKAKTVANAQIAGHADKVQKAQQDLMNAKQKLSGKERVKAFFAKQSTELEGKKFYQRLVPGVTWQVYKRDYVSVDLALQTGYRVSPRLTAGVGFLYRFGVDKDFDTFVRGLKTYGGRAYLDFAVQKGIFAHGEFEGLKVDPTLVVPGTPEPIENHAYASYFGLGKRFNVTRNLRGSILALYRLEYEGELPGVNKISARFGVEYVFRRARKKLPGL